VTAIEEHVHRGLKLRLSYVDFGEFQYWLFHCGARRVISGS
jgi:hypothetical protein